MQKSKLLYDYARVTLFLTLFMIAYTFYSGFLYARYLMLFSSPILFAIIYSSKKEKNTTIKTNIYIGYCSVIAFLLCVYSGGANSIVLPWFILIPVLALMLQERKLVIFWSIACVLQMMLLFFTDPLVAGSAYIFDGFSVWGNNFMLNISLMSLITAFVLIIGESQRKIQMVLSTTIENLKATEEELRQNMEELSSTQDTLQKINNQLEENNIVLQETNLDLNSQKQTIAKKKEVLKRFAHTLYQLTKNEYIQIGDLDNSLKLLIKEGIVALEISRISIWLYNEDYTQLVCQLLGKKNEESYESGFVLYKDSIPKYFERIKEDAPLVMIDVNSDYFSQEFHESYSIPLDIKSTMDIPLFVNGNSMGVVCYENQFEEKYWSNEELLFAKSITDLIAISYQSAERAKNTEILQNQRDEIQLQHNNLEKLTEQLKISNESLDQRVSERTIQLTTQNEYFAEYTFINVHLLRAPLCRILGLSELLKLGQLSPDDKDLMNKLDFECKDLESLIAKITKVLESGEIMDRIKIKE